MYFPDHLQYLDESMQRVVEPGELELMVGDSSQTVEKIRLMVLIGWTDRLAALIIPWIFTA